MTVKLALDWYAQGLYFADALHFASSRLSESLRFFRPNLAAGRTANPAGSQGS